MREISDNLFLSTWRWNNVVGRIFTEYKNNNLQEIYNKLNNNTVPNKVPWSLLYIALDLDVVLTLTPASVWIFPILVVVSGEVVVISKVVCSIILGTSGSIFSVVFVTSGSDIVKFWISIDFRFLTFRFSSWVEFTILVVRKLVVDVVRVVVVSVVVVIKVVVVGISVVSGSFGKYFS